MQSEKTPLLVSSSVRQTLKLPKAAHGTHWGLRHFMYREFIIHLYFMCMCFYLSEIWVEVFPGGVCRELPWPPVSDVLATEHEQMFSAWVITPGLSESGRTSALWPHTRSMFSLRPQIIQRLVHLIPVSIWLRNPVLTLCRIFFFFSRQSFFFLLFFISVTLCLWLRHTLSMFCSLPLKLSGLMKHEESKAITVT